MNGQQVVDFGEFRENLTTYLASGETIIVTQDGRQVGIFVPTIAPAAKAAESPRAKVTEPEDVRAKWAAFEKAAARLDALLEEYGITEDEAIEEFERLRRESRQG